jgi:hypothetical protein
VVDKKKHDEEFGKRITKMEWQLFFASKSCHKKTAGQGDQIGRIFAYWAIFYFELF